MDKEQLAKNYVNRINTCFFAMKILMIAAVVAIAALLIFVMIAVGTNMWDSNSNGVLWGIIVPGMLAAACVIGEIALLIIAKLTITKLKKLDTGK